MAKLIDTLSWYDNGEKVNAAVLNKPLKELVNLFDSNQFNVPMKTQGMSLSLDDLDGVQEEDFIYLSSDGIGLISDERLIEFLGNEAVLQEDYVTLTDYDKDKPEILADRQACRYEIKQLEQSL